MRMKIILLLILLLPLVSSYPYICCKDRETLQDKCFRSGECCNGKWHERCYDFDLWYSAAGLTIGAPGAVNVYVRNKGAYADSYTISYQIISGEAFVNIENNRSTVGPSQVTSFTPRVILLSSNPVTIRFTVKSSNQEKSIDAILSAGSMYSMPEISTILLIFIPTLAAIIYRKV
jgi:hypothetical protein